ncbi:MAG: hypothetical protein AB1584_11665 [Pseudomonadota bacterium]
MQLFIAGMALWEPGLLDLADDASGLTISWMLALAIALLLMTQSVRIDGSFVSVRNITSCFRWRKFDASEIDELQYWTGTSGDLMHCLVVSLHPAQHRSWRRVRIVVSTTEGGHAGTSAPLLRALTHAFSQFRPGLEIRGLPPDHRSDLTPSISFVAPPEVPSNRGKTRRRKQIAAANRARRKGKAGEGKA